MNNFLYICFSLVIFLSISFCEKSISYYENGQVESDSNYIDGKKDGKWIWYYEDGSLEREETYKYGIFIDIKEY